MFQVDLASINKGVKRIIWHTAIDKQESNFFNTANYIQVMVQHNL